MLCGEVLWRHKDLEAHDLVALLLEPGNNVGNKAAVDTIGLDPVSASSVPPVVRAIARSPSSCLSHDERALLGHISASPSGCKPKSGSSCKCAEEGDGGVRLGRSSYGGNRKQCKSVVRNSMSQFPSEQGTMPDPAMAEEKHRRALDVPIGAIMARRSASLALDILSQDMMLHTV